MNVTLELVSQEDLQVLLPLLERLRISYQLGVQNRIAKKNKRKISKLVRLTESKLKERLNYLAEGRADRNLPNR